MGSSPFPRVLTLSQTPGLCMLVPFQKSVKGPCDYGYGSPTRTQMDICHSLGQFASDIRTPDVLRCSDDSRHVAGACSRRFLTLMGTQKWPMLSIAPLLPNSFWSVYLGHVRFADAGSLGCWLHIALSNGTSMIRERSAIRYDETSQREAEEARQHYERDVHRCS